jgi:hypothetical protein
MISSNHNELQSENLQGFKVQENKTASLKMVTTADDGISYGRIEAMSYSDSSSSEEG